MNVRLKEEMVINLISVKGAANTILFTPVTLLPAPLSLRLALERDDLLFPLSGENFKRVFRG